MPFPFSPLQFTNPGLDFFRAWLFELIPVALLVIVAYSNLVSDKTVKIPALVFLLPVAVCSTLLAIWDGGRGIFDAVEKNQNIFCKPRQTIKVASGSIISCDSFDLVNHYLEVRQEWVFLPGVKLVRYIDRFTDPPPVSVSVIDGRTIHYDGDPVGASMERTVW